MAEGFEYFTSADAGAPVLQAQRGRLIAVLDWVLTGKGGWDKAFTGTNLAVYRSQSGNRHYLRVDDTQIRYSRLRGYRTMTTVTNGTLPFPATANAPLNTWGVSKGYVEGTAPRRYWGVRTNRYVMLFIEYFQEAGDDQQGINYVTLMCFGEVPSLAESDGFNTIIGGCQSVDLSHVGEFFSEQVPALGSMGPATGTGAPYFAFAGSPDGTVASVAAALQPPFANSTGMAPTTVTNVAKNNRLHYAPFLLLSSNRADGDNGLYPRALLPNFYQVWNPIRGTPHADSPATWMEEFTLNGNQFIVLTEGGSSNPAYLDRWSRGGLLQKNDTGMAL